MKELEACSVSLLQPIEIPVVAPLGPASRVGRAATQQLSAVSHHASVMDPSAGECATGLPTSKWPVMANACVGSRDETTLAGSYKGGAGGSLRQRSNPAGCCERWMIRVTVRLEIRAQEGCAWPVTPATVRRFAAREAVPARSARTCALGAPSAVDIMTGLTSYIQESGLPL